VSKEKQRFSVSEKVLVGVIVALSVILVIQRVSANSFMSRLKDVEIKTSETETASETETTETITETETKNEDTKLININTASASELCELQGIGEKKAQAIIDYRNENGGFVTIEEIMNVSGIGEKTFQNIKDKITVD